MDAWSLGILAYELLVGRSPFGRSESLRAAEERLESELEVPAWISEKAAAFIRSALFKVSATFDDGKASPLGQDFKKKSGNARV